MPAARWKLQRTIPETPLPSRTCRPPTSAPIRPMAAPFRPTTRTGARERSAFSSDRGGVQVFRCSGVQDERPERLNTRTPEHHPPGHIPVMLAEVLDLLSPRPGGLYLDATVGLGGHAASVLDRLAPLGRLLGLDRDPAALEMARDR